METLSEDFAPFEKKEPAAAASDKDLGKQPTIGIYSPGKISKAADSSQHPKQDSVNFNRPQNR